MARILQYPAVKQVSSNKWVLLEDLEYHVGSSNSNDVIVAHKGFRTDFASIPRIFWSVLPPYGKYSPASVLHDFLYAEKGRVPFERPKPRTRKECDQIFLEAMLVMDVKYWKRQTMFRAVRLFGGFSW